MTHTNFYMSHIDDEDGRYDDDDDDVYDCETHDSVLQDQCVLLDVCKGEKNILRAQTFHSKLPLITM